jgi:hypothetical protein
MSEAAVLRDSKAQRERAVVEMRERRDRLNAATMRIPHTELALADQAARDAGSADTAYRLGLYAADTIDETIKEGTLRNHDVVGGEINVHVCTLCRCLLESRRLEA